MRSTLRTAGVGFIATAARATSGTAVARKQRLLLSPADPNPNSCTTASKQDEHEFQPPALSLEDEDSRATRAVYRAWRQGAAHHSPASTLLRRALSECAVPPAFGTHAMKAQEAAKPASTTTSQPAAPLPRIVADFDGVELLGRGGFGYVYAATNIYDGHRYALKLCNLQQTGSPLTSEAQCLASLPCHDHLVRYYGAWSERNHSVRDLRMALAPVTGDNEVLGDLDSADEDDSSTNEHETSLRAFDGGASSLVLQMELLESTTLQDLLRSKMLASVNEAADAKWPATVQWQWIAGIASGLQVMHEHGWLHNDVKPANCLCSPDGSIKLCDFGLVSRTATDGGGKGGTPTYMAPERLDEEELASIGPPSDVFSLGVCAAEILAGFSTAMERAKVLATLRKHAVRGTGSTGRYEEGCSDVCPDAGPADLVRQMMAGTPHMRPTAAMVESEARGYYGKAAGACQGEVAPLRSP